MKVIGIEYDKVYKHCSFWYHVDLPVFDKHTCSTMRMEKYKKVDRNMLSLYRPLFSYKILSILTPFSPYILPTSVNVDIVGRV